MKRITLLFLPIFITACATGADPESGQDIPSAAQASTPAMAPATSTPTGTPAATPDLSRISYFGVDIPTKHVALTFDDGPHKTFTPELLDILAKRNVRATFYVVGQNVAAYPEIAARIVRDGHEIANHTWSHAWLTKISQANVRSQIARAEKAIIDATGVKPTTFRPPFGAYTNSMAAMINREFGYKNIMWTVDPLDWKRPGTAVVTQRIVSGAAPGAIILAHDIHQATIRAIPSAIDQLLAQGYQFVTVAELIAMEAAQPRRASAAAAGAPQTTTP